jgi:hypothetical protein
MTLTAKLETDLIVSLDTDQKNTLWSMTDTALNQIVRSDLTVYSAGVASVAASASMTLPLNDVAAGKILILRSDKRVGVKINGSVTEIVIGPSGTYKGLMVVHGEFTTVIVTNKDTVNATQVEYCFVGLEV